MTAPRPFLGRGLHARLAPESSWGTPISSGSLTHSFDLSSATLAQATTKGRRNLLGGSTGSANSRGHFLSGRTVTGALSGLVPYHGFGLLLREALLGTPSTSGPTDGLYTHDTSIGTRNPTGITVEVNRGTGAGQVFAGCVVNRLALECRAGEEMKWTADLIGKSAAARGAQGTGASWRTSYINAHHAGALTWNGLDFYLVGFKLTIDNKFAARNLLGDLATAEPARSGMCEITWELELESSETGDDIVAAFHDDDADDCAITWEDPVTSHSLTLFGHNCYVDSASDPVSAAGVTSLSVTLKSESDGSDEGLTVRQVNDLSSAVAA